MKVLGSDISGDHGNRHAPQSSALDLQLCVKGLQFGVPGDLPVDRQPTGDSLQIPLSKGAQFSRKLIKARRLVFGVLWVPKGSP